jgi:hypothetical protein
LGKRDDLAETTKQQRNGEDLKESGINLNLAGGGPRSETLKVLISRNGRSLGPILSLFFDMPEPSS